MNAPDVLELQADGAVVLPELSDDAPTGDGHDLVVRPHPLTLQGRTMQRLGAQPGETLAELLTRGGVQIADAGWVVTVNGAEVPLQLLHRTRPKAGMVIECRRVAGKSALRTIAFIVLAYIVLSTTGPLAQFLAAANITGFTAFAIQTAVFMIGAAVINKVLPPPRLRQRIYEQETGSTYSLSGGRNRARPFEPIGLILGSTRCVPDFAAQPFAWFDGDEQYQAIRLAAGIDCASVDFLRIGATPIANYQEVTVSTLGFPSGNTGIADWANVDSVAGATLTGSTAVTRTSSPNTVRLAVDLVASLYDMADDGSMAEISVAIDIHYRPVGGGLWAPLDAGGTTITLTSRSTRPVRRTVLSATLPAGQYEVRCTKVSGDIATTRKNNAVEWQVLKSYQADTRDLNGYPEVGIRIRASGQLNGVLDEVNWVAFQRPIPVWNGSAWITQASSNPGALILRLARGIFDPAGRLQAGLGLPDAQIDIEALQAFMVHCAAQGYRFDLWLDQQMSRLDLLESIAASALASISWHTGKLGVVWLASGQPIEAVVNMANIKAGSFRVDHNTDTTAEELEVTWFDRDTDYQARSIRLLAPGVMNPRETARLAPSGCTTEAHAVRVGRFTMGQTIYQRKSVQWEMDLEHLAFRRYSVIALSHDLTAWGYGGRLAGAVSAAGVVTLTLDEPVPFNPSATARTIGLRIPGEQGYRLFSVAAWTGETRTVTLATAWPAGVPLPGSSEANPAWDTLWIYDFAAQPGKRLRVTAIEPQGMSSARITAVEEPPEFWSYMASGAYTAPLLPSDRPPLVASDIRVTQRLLDLNVSATAELGLIWSVQGTMASAQVWGAPTGQPLVMIGTTLVPSYPAVAVSKGGSWTFEVRPFDELGRPGTKATITHSIGLGSLTAGGVKTLILYAYQRSATVPTGPTSAATYDFGARVLSGLDNGWSATIPAGTDPLYIIAATASTTGTSDEILPAEWASPVLFVQNGAQGATVYLFARTTGATPPALPGTTTYTFASGELTGALGAWSQTLPATGGSQRWMITASALSAGATDTILSGEWAPPALLAQDGTNGTNGTNGLNGADGAPGSPGTSTALIYIYQRSASGAPALPSANATFTFSTAALTGLDNGWSTTIPAGTAPIYVSVATASGTGATDTITPAEWAGAALLAQNGANGSNGLNSATVYLFQRTAVATAPAVPTGDVTYTFATGGVSGALGAWSQTLPQNGGPYRWMITASALSAGATDTVTPAEWAAPSLLATDGASGFTWVTSGAATAFGAVAQKATGVTAWDSQAYSAEGYIGSAYCAFRLTGGSVMAGLNQDPTTSASWETLDYAWHRFGGLGYIVESGSFVAGPFAGFTDSTRLSIVYDGTQVSYARDGTIQRTVTVAAGLRFHLDSSFEAPGAQIQDTAFGPSGPRGAAAVSSGADKTSIVLTADSTGIVDSGQLPQTITAFARLGGVDDTAAWSWTVGNSGGMTTSISGSVVTFSGIANSTDAGTITITGNKSGQPTQTITVAVGKAKRATPNARPVDGFYQFNAFTTSSGGPAIDAWASVVFYSNGSCEGFLTGVAQFAPNWFTPTTGGIGADYDIRFDVIQSNGLTGGEGGVSGTWLQLSTTRGVSITTTEDFAGAFRGRTWAYTIRRRSDLAVVASGTIVLTAEVI